MSILAAAAVVLLPLPLAALSACVVGAYCGGRPPWLHLAAIGGLGGVAVLLASGGGLDLASGLALTWTLLTLAAVDLRVWRLPDVLTIGLIAAGLAVTAGSPAAVLDRAIGVAAGYLSLALVAAAYVRLRRREGLGLGDAKLLAAGGAWLGWRALPYVVLAASLATLALVVIMRKRASTVSTTAVPFGPGLAAAIWATWIAERFDLTNVY